MIGYPTLVISLLAITIAPTVVMAQGVLYKDYDNDFVDPSYILAKNFDPSTAWAQETIVQWADYLAAQGPWCESRGCVR